MKWIFVAVFLRFSGVQSCSLDTSLHGTWTTTNFGTVTIQDASPQLSMTQLFLGVTGSSTDFNCLLISDDKYVLQSNNTVTVFSGTTEIFIYMCISFTETSTNTFYYYLNSNVETGLDNYRLVGLPTSTSVTMASQVCTATPDIAEYHMMVRDGVTGYEQGTVQLPAPLLGLFLYTYTRDGTAFCDTVNATVNSCDNQTLTSVFANDSNCNTANTFYSADGVLGCVASLYSTSRLTYYVTLYNGDTSVDSTNTFRFSCLAVSSDTNGTVYLTVKPTSCDGGQNSTTAPSPGALMVLQPVCIPTSDDSDYTVLIVLLCVFGALIIVIIIIFVCCYLRYRKKKKVKAREKKMLVSEDHPLGEVSIALDTPATMEPVVLENGIETFRSPRRKKSLANNPLSESSMNLDFIGRQWTTPPRSGSRMVMDPLTEMETGAIVPLGLQGQKSIRSLKSRQSSFVGRPFMNGDVKQPLALTDSKPKELNAKSLMNGGVVSKPGSKDLVRSSTMIKAPSVRSARSVKASSIVTESLKSNGAVMRVSSIKGKNKPTLKPSKPTRSATSTRIGSVTKGSSIKRMTRADTVIVPTKTEDGPGEDKTEQVHDFLSGEMTTVGSISARSEDGRTRKSGKSTKSKSSTARSTGPSRSLKKQSESRRQMSLIEMSEAAVYLPEPDRDHSFMSRDLMRESFRTARELKELRLRAKKPSASKSPWK